MGMSASQARLLHITNRMHQIEYGAQRIEAQKLQLANDSRRVYAEYLDALDAKKIQGQIVNEDASIGFVDLSLKLMEDLFGSNMATSLYLQDIQTGKTYITGALAAKYNLTPDLELNSAVEFLENAGITVPIAEYPPIENKEGEVISTTNVELGTGTAAPNSVGGSVTITPKSLNSDSIVNDNGNVELPNSSVTGASLPAQKTAEELKQSNPTYIDISDCFEFGNFNEEIYNSTNHFYITDQSHEDFYSIIYMINNSGLSTEGKTFTLCTDLSISQMNDSIGTDTNPFQGVLDGNGHTIDENGLGKSLFNVIDGGTIQNLKYQNAYISGAQNGAGILANSATNATIDNIYLVTGSIYADSAGCLIGESVNSSITNITLGNVTANGTNSGCIAGQASGSTINNVYYFGNVEETVGIDNGGNTITNVVIQNPQPAEPYTAAKVTIPTTEDIITNISNAIKLATNGENSITDEKIGSWVNSFISQRTDGSEYVNPPSGWLNDSALYLGSINDDIVNYVNNIINNGTADSDIVTKVISAINTNKSTLDGYTNKYENTTETPHAAFQNDTSIATPIDVNADTTYSQTIGIPLPSNIAENIYSAFRNMGKTEEFTSLDDIQSLTDWIHNTYNYPQDEDSRNLAELNKLVTDYLIKKTNPSKIEEIYQAYISNTQYNNFGDTAAYSNINNLTVNLAINEEIREPQFDYDSPEIAEALNFWEVIKNGFIIVDDEWANSTVWFTNMVNSGTTVLIEQDKKKGEIHDTSVATNTKIREVSDETDLKKAEAKYEADMRRIDMKDRQYDTELAALESERNALKEEGETLKNVAKDNVDRTFKLFS